MKDIQLYIDATMVGSREDAQDYLRDLAIWRKKKEPGTTLRECREYARGHIACVAHSLGPEVEAIVEDFYHVKHPYVPGTAGNKIKPDEIEF
jgi:ribosomal protein L35AE/L33A